MSDSDSRFVGGPRTRAANWLLLEGNRLTIAGGVVLVTGLVLLALLWKFGLSSLEPRSPVYLLFSALLTGNLTLVTVVLSINQLVLSRELDSPGGLQQRIEDARSYRSSVESVTEMGVSPNAPTRFLGYLHESMETRTRRLGQSTSAVRDKELRDALQSLVRELQDDVRMVDQKLKGKDADVFTVVGATLDTNHAQQLHQIATIREGFGDSLSDDQTTLLDHIEDLLCQIDVAVNYLKTVYVQKELAYLSRVLLYVGVPAIVSSGLTLVFYNTASGMALPRKLLSVVIVGSFTFAFAPLAILFAFVLRLAWIAQRTASVAPFTSGSAFQK